MQQELFLKEGQPSQRTTLWDVMRIGAHASTHTTVMEHAFDRSQMKKLKKEAEEVTDLDGKAARVSSRHV